MKHTMIIGLVALTSTATMPSSCNGRLIVGLQFRIVNDFAFQLVGEREPLFPRAVTYRLLERFMRPIAMLGVVLIVLGIAGLFFSRIGWTETKAVAKLGPLQVNSQEVHTIWIPTVAGVAAVVAGVGLVFAAKRSA